MAITQRGRNVMEMTAVDDEFPDSIDVKGFSAITSAAGGEVVVNNSAGSLVWRSGAMNANERNDSQFPQCSDYDGLKVASIPAGAVLLIHFK